MLRLIKIIELFTCMSCLERATVVAAVSTHDHLSAKLLQTLYQLYLLLGQHASEDLASVNNPLEQLWIMSSDHPEGGAITREHIVLTRHVLVTRDYLQLSNIAAVKCVCLQR